MRKQPYLFITLFLVLLLLAGCATGPSYTSEPIESEIWIPESTHASDFPTSPETVPPIPTESLLSTEEPTSSIPEDSFFEVHFLDVGQADCAIVLCDGQAMIIDGGNSEDSSMVYSYLKKLGIGYLDYVIATHAHEDHVGGLSGALSYATPGTIYSPGTSYDTKAFSKFAEKVEGHNCSITVPNHGDSFLLGTARCTIIGPIYPSDDTNNTSIVLRIDYGNTSFLFTGDAEDIEEREILDYGYSVDCDVLKVGHHGSDTSSCYRWLRESSPDYAVISVGKNNSYGHPHEDTLSRLRDAEVKVFRTDMQGTVICYSDGLSVSFTVERNADADTLAGAGAGGNHGAGNETTPGAGQITYVVNTNTKKFHYPDCSSVSAMSDKNRMDVYVTRDELIAQGYIPCGRCDP